MGLFNKSTLDQTALERNPHGDVLFGEALESRHQTILRSVRIATESLFAYKPHIVREEAIALAAQKEGKDAKVAQIDQAARVMMQAATIEPTESFATTASPAQNFDELSAADRQAVIERTIDDVYGPRSDNEKIA